MKVPDKIKNKKEKVKKKSGVNKPKPKKEQVLVVAQEIKYARWLSGNDKKTRDRVLKALKKWILNCFEKGYEFKEEDFTRVWKGLFYAVWMSDKPLVQEELCENIAAVLDLFPPEQLKHALMMTKAGFKMLATEWYGIDHHRMDKFLMLVRRYLRGSLRCLKRCEWSLASCQKYAKMLAGNDGLFAVSAPHYVRNSTSMLLHITDCFLEELSKVSQGKIPEESVAALLHPFVQYMCSGTTLTVCTATRRLLTALLRQSDIGLQYEDKTRAWKQMGCPAGGPDALELVSDDEEVNGANESEEDDDSGRALDPRAGRVHVRLRALAAPARALAAMLADALGAAPAHAQRRLRICLQRFQMLAGGQYPLPVSVPEVPAGDVMPRARRAANALREFEHKLKVDTDELKLRGLSRKHRKRLLRKSRAGLSIVEDVDEHKKELSKESNNGEWLVESTESKSKKTAKDTSSKENQEKTRNDKNAKKRKEDPQQSEVNNKKRKLDKNNSEDKKNNLVNDKSSKKDKNKVTQNNKTEETKSTKPKDGKSKESKTIIKNDSLKEVKTKKPKSQPQMISLRSDKIKFNKDQSDKTETNAKDKAKSNKTEITKQVKETSPKLSKIDNKTNKPTVLVNKVKNFQKQVNSKEKKDLPVKKTNFGSPKRVKFELKKNSMQQPVDYYKSVRQSPSIPFDGSKKPSKTNLKPSTPSPINPFFKKKLRMKL